MIRAAFQLWRCKWGLVRLAMACFVVYVLATDGPARLARLQLAALPGFDYLAEVRALRAQGRYGEAVMVAEAGLRERPDAGLEAERAATVAERDSWLRKASAAGKGALTGRGDSLEALIGAVAADFFVVGDVRDLVIEGGKQMLDGDSDEVVLLLSAVGIGTTLAPQIDWAPSILKAAKRAGHMSTAMGDYLKKSLKARRTDELARVCEDVAAISKKASPGGAMRALKLADSPEDLARLARFVEKNPSGAFALHVTGGQGAFILKGAGEAGEQLVLSAAKKGRAGAEYLTGPVVKALTRPHVLVGVIKAVWKGNAERLITRIVDRIDPNAWWLLPLGAAWAVFEAGLLAMNLRAAPGTSRRASSVRSDTPMPARG